MKRIIFLLVFALIAVPIQAQEQEEEWETVLKKLEEEVKPPSRPSPVSPVQRRVFPSMPRRVTPIVEEKLVNLDASRTATRIEELERRVTDLERDLRFQDKRLRSLDREIDELRRRVD